MLLIRYVLARQYTTDYANSGVTLLDVFAYRITGLSSLLECVHTIGE